LREERRGVFIGGKRREGEKRERRIEQFSSVIDSP
jgi:hypothetical protein